jgi:hypothetical protein
MFLVLHFESQLPASPPLKQPSEIDNLEKLYHLKKNQEEVVLF